MPVRRDISLVDTPSRLSVMILALSINFTIPFLLAFAKTFLLLIATLEFYHESFLVHLSGLILN
jgi:hypothetical protein